MSIDRRAFLRGLAGAGLAGAGFLIGCDTPVGPAGVLPDVDVSGGDASVTSDRGSPDRHDAAITDMSPADTAPPLARQFWGYEGLAKLPFFDLDASGRLRCTVKDLPPAIDFHTHLGFRYLTAPKIDYLANTAWTHYLFDHVAGEPPFSLDLDAYLNKIATEKMKSELNKILASASTVGSPTCKGHTITNLIAEMDRMGIDKVVTLPLVLHLPFGDDAPERYLDAYDAADTATKERLLIFGCVHPRRKPLDTVKGQIARGIRGLKIHPPMQRVYPDDPDLMPVYEACGKAGIPVLWHGGRTGLEASFTGKYAEGKHYRSPVAQFPNTRFVMGHCGAIKDWQAAVAIGKQHKNLFFETAGQGIPVLEQVLAAVGPDRLLYGSDWPFYPEAATLAKVLIMTEHDNGLRRQILRDNAAALLGI